MKKALAAALVLLLAPALAEAKGTKKKKKAPVALQVHPFADVPISALQVAQTRNGQAAVENKNGEVVLVRAGDHLGSEGYEVVKVTLGCVQLKSVDADLTLCVDVPEVPRT